MHTVFMDESNKCFLLHRVLGLPLEREGEQGGERCT